MWQKISYIPYLCHYVILWWRRWECSILLPLHIHRPASLSATVMVLLASNGKVPRDHVWKAANIRLLPVVVWMKSILYLAHVILLPCESCLTFYSVILSYLHFEFFGILFCYFVLSSIWNSLVFYSVILYCLTLLCSFDDILCSNLFSPYPLLVTVVLQITVLISRL